MQLQHRVHDPDVLPADQLHELHICAGGAGTLGQPEYRRVHTTAAGKHQIEETGESHVMRHITVTGCMSAPSSGHSHVMMHITVTGSVTAPSDGNSHNAVAKIRPMQIPWRREEGVPKLENTTIFHVFFGTDTVLKIEGGIMDPCYEILN